MNDATNENDAANYRIIKNKTTKSKSFEYKTKLLGSTPANANRLDEDIVVSFKYLDKVWRCLDLPLINYERELDLSWLINFVISEMSRTCKVAANPPNLAREEVETTGTTFQIKSAKVLNFISL